MQPFRLLETVTEPGFATDSEGTIVAWNAAASELLDRDAGDALGRYCYDVLQGKDVFGNRYCGPNCPLQRMAKSTEPVHHCRLRFATPRDEWIDCSVSVMVVDGESCEDRFLVHVLGSEPVDAYRSTGREENPSSSLSLTPRELDVLTLLEGGASTVEIADLLCISTATVRNHVHHVLGKLKSHSRLQAVARARREGWL